MIGLVCRIAAKTTKPCVKTKQQKQYPNPEEHCMSNFSSNSCLFLKLQDWQQNKNHQASFRRLHSPPTPSFLFSMEKRYICSVLSLSTSPPDFPHCISPCSLQFTEQNNSGSCCNSSHWLPSAADFLAFPSPPNWINSIPSPSSSSTSAHSPSYQSAPQTSILSSSLHVLLLMLHELCSPYLFPLLALEGAAGLLTLPLPTSLPVRLASASFTNVVL